MNLYDIDTSNNEPSGFGRSRVLAEPDGYGINTGSCGDTIEFFIAARESEIQDIRYQTNGCAATHLCASVVVSLLRGREIDFAWQIRPELIIGAIPELPADHHHCAELAAGALYLALSDLQDKARKPWAKLYRTNRTDRL